MIATNDIKTILYKAVKAHYILGAFPEISKDRHKAVTEQTVKERIVVVVNATDNSDWQGTYARICVYVPKIKAGTELYPNTSRLTELERVCTELFYKRTFIEIEGQTLYYKLEDIVQEDDSETWSDFLNVRLKVTNQNFKL
ncbi:hypothetical protein D0T84_00765 [Dysgonomonas sp. 521]|uniref:hypothetical protein n=1 Tax=Dysgonomonas sp. 521 TaxID=2302932 RepID=UPI0013D7F28E|nr:hypothetical protein [Dysgonomonas sp. 521]NDV93449.1 hypothetical protein [Dysgonomonas sp. 521]